MYPMDEFKTYLQQHAGELDTDEPRPQVWEHLAQRVAVKKVVPLRVRYMRWAVAACLTLLLGSLLWLVWPARHNTTEVVKNQPVKTGEPAQPATTAPGPQQQVTAAEPAKEGISNETNHKNAFTAVKPAQEPPPTHPDETLVLHHLEAGFIQVISMQLNKVRSMPLYAEGPQYFSSFKKQFAQLDEDEKALKREIRNTGITDSQLDALIDIYQQKINVLKQLQNEIKKTNNAYRQNHPVSASPTFMNI